MRNIRVGTIARHNHLTIWDAGARMEDSKRALHPAGANKSRGATGLGLRPAGNESSAETPKGSQDCRKSERASQERVPGRFPDATNCVALAETRFPPAQFKTNLEWQRSGSRDACDCLGATIGGWQTFHFPLDQASLAVKTPSRIPTHGRMDNEVARLSLKVVASRRRHRTQAPTNSQPSTRELFGLSCCAKSRPESTVPASRTGCISKKSMQGAT